MKSNLPELNIYTLTTIFNSVYDEFIPNRGNSEEISEEIADLLTVLKAMQFYNYKRRSEDTRALFFQLNNIFSFEINSDGTTLFLSLALAIKELYGLSNTNFKILMRKFARKK